MDTPEVAPVDTRLLKFYIQGSAKKPYCITAEGEGASLRVFCTCPAGARGGKFCKHAAAVLVGDVTALVEPSDDVCELGRRAAGSHLAASALLHKAPSPPRAIGGMETLDDVLAAYGERMERQGWEIQRENNDGEFPSDRILLFARFKNGKLRKRPSATLSWEQFSYDGFGPPGPTESREGVRRRTRPWSVTGQGGCYCGTWAALSRAIPHFLDEAEIEL